MIRRKRESECFNGDKFERKTVIEKCECTEEDWECDIGYERKSDDGPCLPIEGNSTDFSAPESCSDYYYVSQGYRRIAGDQCEGGVDHQ